MKKNKRIITMFICLLLIISCKAQIKNSKTGTIEIYGICDMCKETIETAADKKNEVSLHWNQNSKIATVNFDSNKTTLDVILKRVALAGYDNEKFLAPSEAYNKLPACCKYERKKSVMVDRSGKHDDMQRSNDTIKGTANISPNPLSEVYAAYFKLKDALAKDNGILANTSANALYKAIEDVKMDSLAGVEHAIWMKYEKALSYDAEHIKGVTELEHQREHFTSLSKNMYEVMKVINLNSPVYYDFCPMANNGKGANWLSLEKPISNPFMGKAMPTCGKIQETIK